MWVKPTARAPDPLVISIDVWYGFGKRPRRGGFMGQWGDRRQEANQLPATVWWNPALFPGSVMPKKHTGSFCLQSQHHRGSPQGRPQPHTADLVSMHQILVFKLKSSDTCGHRRTRTIDVVSLPLCFYLVAGVFGMLSPFASFCCNLPD